MIRHIAISIFLLSQCLVFGQATDNSIFSRFGIGDIVTPGYSSFTAMGGAASGYYTTYTINSVNPASYSRLTTAAFDIGLSARNFSTEIAGTTGDRLWSGNLDNVAIAFPLKNSLNKALDPLSKPIDFGIAFGINPISRVGYNVSSIETDSDLGNIERNYKGFGGLYEFFWGSSVEYKNFSAGINAKMYFGRLNYEKNILFIDIPAAFNNLFSTSYNAQGLGLDYGVMYTHVFNKADLEQNIVGNSLTIGFHGSTGANLNATADTENILFQNYSNVAITDTLLSDTGIEGELKLPANLGVGVSYQQGTKWAISAAYTTTPWSKYENTLVTETLRDVTSFNIGGWFTPNAKSYTSYFKRIRYKAGAFYRTEPTQISVSDQGGEVENYGVTLGTQLPFVSQRKISRGDISATLGYKGNDFINEKYIILKFGFTFNDDQWFLKRKYN